MCIWCGGVYVWCGCVCMWCGVCTCGLIHVTINLGGDRKEGMG